MSDRKPRKPWQKEGRYRHLLNKINRFERTQKEGYDELNRKLTILLNSISPILEIDNSFFKKTVCKDEVDERLFEHLITRGTEGITPTEACASKELAGYSLKPYQVTRRIQRMNKRARTELDKQVAINLHRRWRRTSFAAQSLASERDET